MDHSDHTHSTTLLKRLLGDYVIHHWQRLALAMICMVIVAATTAANAWLMQPVLDDIFLDQNREMLRLIPMAILALAVIKAAGTYGQSVLMQYIGQRIISDMQFDLYKHLMQADLALFHTQSSGSLISRFTNDIALLRNAVSTVLTGLAKELLTLIFLVGVMFYQNAELAIIAFIVFPVAIYPTARLGKRMRKISRAMQQELGQFTSRLDESFQGIRIIKAYGQEAAETSRAQTTIENVFRQYVKSFRVKAAASPIMELLAGIAIAAIIGYGGHQVLQNDTTPGAFFSFIAAMIMAYKPMKSMAGLNTNLQEGLGAADRVYAMLDIPSHIHSKPDAPDLQLRDGHIRFEHLRFHYEAEKPVLEDVSFEIGHNQMVALVGPSGSGKSSLINLLLRFYDPEDGHITIDGQDIREVSLSSLRGVMSLVSQETILFDDTVRANICFGREDASEADMIDAAKQAEAHEFITALPNGYDTMIGQHGVMLSGGQRQRLAIARAMLHNAPILLLDEATSALDPIAEQKIQAALERLMQGRTTLVIAHRLSTIRQADCIHVLKDGKIVESGTHETLMKQGGTYQTLYQVGG